MATGYICMYYHRDTTSSINEITVCATFVEVISYATAKAGGIPLKVAFIRGPALPTLTAPVSEHGIEVIDYNDLALEGIELPDNTICEIVWPVDGREPGYNAPSIAVMPL